MGVGPCDREQATATLAAQGGRRVEKGPAAAAARADGVSEVVGLPAHERPEGRPERQDLEGRARNAQRLTVDLEDGFASRELDEGIPSDPAQRTFDAWPHAGPEPRRRPARAR